MDKIIFNQILVFDRALVRRNRDRAALHFAKHLVLFEETSHQLMERLGDVKRESFARSCAWRS